MAGESDGVPADSLEAVAYLARSANRVTLLEALSKESYGRRELGEATDASPTTVSRIINEFEEFGWAERRSNGNYAATPTGTLVIEEFVPLVESVAAIQALGDAASWLPKDELAIGFRHFGDATVRRSAPNAPLETVGYLADAIRDATTFRVVTSIAPPSPVDEALQESVVAGGLTAELVLGGGLVEYLRDQGDGPPDWRRCIEVGLRMYRLRDRVPCHVFLLDGTALIMNDRPPGRRAFLESENETVLEGMNELFENYREAAERVDAGVFA